MKKVSKMLVLSILAMLMFSGVLSAEERDRNGEVGGNFVRLVEQEVGEREYMGIVIKPHDRDGHVTVLIPWQREELVQAVRRLREGQIVGVSFVTEAGHKWIKGMEAERREVVEEGPEGRRRMSVRREVLRYEDDRERRDAGRPEYLEQMQELKRILSSNLDRIAREFRELRGRLEQQERELHRLRAENEQLRRELRERAGSAREREREVRIRVRREGREQEEREVQREREVRREAEYRREGMEREEREVRSRRVERREVSLPDGMAGFRGVLVGRVLRKLDRGFILKVERVTNVWENNRADRPEAAVGKELIVTIRAEEELGGRFLRTLRALKIGERVLVEAFHFEGNRLTVVEQLRKAE